MFPSAGLGALTCLLGFWVVYGMANVYMLRSMAVWNRWRTLAGFLCSAVLLGLFYLLPVWMLDGQRAGAALPGGVVVGINSLGLLLLAGELGLMYGGLSHLGWVGRLRVGVLVVCLLGLISGLSVPGLFGLPFAVVLFILLWIEELLGRWSFYSELDRRRL